MIGHLGLSALICGSDLVIKETVKKKVDENSKTYVCEDKLIVTKFYNRGAALGKLSEHPTLLKGITIFGVGSLLGALTAISGLKGHYLQKFGLSMMLGGAGSNAYERISYGKVTDYVQLNVKNPKYRRIVYNLGDFAIFAGSLCLISGELFRMER